MTSSPTDSFDLAQQILLAPAGLAEGQLEETLRGTLTGGVDYADLYFQHCRHEAWVLEDGMVREASYNLDRGVGVRTLSGTRSGFAYTDDIDRDSLLGAARGARAIVRQGQSGQLPMLNRVERPALYGTEDPLASWSSERKVNLLQEVDRLAREQDPTVKEVTASLAGRHEVVLVLGSDGTLAADVRPLVRLNVSVIAERNGRRERGSAGGGGRVDYDWLL